MLLNEEYMKRELAGRKLLVDERFMTEVNTLFMGRLSADEKLRKIVRENNVDLKEAISIKIDYSHYRNGGSFTVMNDLTQYFLKNDIVSVSGISVTIRNHSVRKGENALCRVNFTTRLVFPAEFGLDGGIKFDYENDYGELCKNEIYEFNNRDRTLKSIFKVSTPSDVVDVLLGVMHNLLKDGE